MLLSRVGLSNETPGAEQSIVGRSNESDLSPVTGSVKFPGQRDAHRSLFCGCVIKERAGR